LFERTRDVLDRETSEVTGEQGLPVVD